ncbi:flagellar biosynthesis anti-sigma factor FlgM [Amphibacillus sp. Q70]|uniref:flagellar biosynthesis anti-sigma factor FlgM n=1 Tax=Amphibacillus sp. Q70 TaxID=3453416 RepID=UPI003F8706EF
MVLKIHGSNQPKVNPYQKQLQKHEQTRTEKQVKADQLQISDQAKKMQELSGVHPARQKRVETIKAQVDAGNYKVDPEKAAKGLLSFWRK